MGIKLAFANFSAHFRLFFKIIKQFAGYIHHNSYLYAQMPTLTLRIPLPHHLQECYP